MAPTIKPSSDQERQTIFNTTYAAPLAAGEFDVIETYRIHPAPNRVWCTSSIFVEVFDKATGEPKIKGHRNEFGGKITTKNGLDPKWILHEGVIYTE